MVGRLSRIRVSSVTRTLPPRTSVGTLKSTRTSTRFPRTSRSRTESFAIILLLLLLVLMLMLLLPLNRVKSFVFTQELCSSRKSLQHSHEHVHDSDEPFLGGKDPLTSDKLSHRKHIEAGSTLERCTASDFQKASAINRGELAISFCDIQGETG